MARLHLTLSNLQSEGNSDFKALYFGKKLGLAIWEVTVRFDLR